MAVSLARRIAARAPVPVHAVTGGDARGAVLGLRAEDGIDLVTSPRAATVLLAAGRLPAAMLEVVRSVHDQLPEPRSLVWWGGDELQVPVVPGAATVPADGDVVATVRRVHGELLREERASTAAAGPGENPVTWQGVGPHGQGGEGMMGGTPYGRGMAMTGVDLHDGLQLDRVPLTLGPALPGFPPGLRLELELQGDVIQQARAVPDLLGGPAHGERLPSPEDVFDTVRTGAVALALLERARARYHLLRLAEALALHGLDAAGRRVARLAVTPTAADPRRVARLRGWLGRSALWSATAGVGRIDAGRVRQLGLSGVTARAAGVAVDARQDHPAYRALGFGITTRPAGDARARWLQRVDEAVQSLELAASAGDATVGPGEPVEDPRAAADALLRQLPDWLAGLEWGDAVTLIASLDLDAAPAPAAPDAVPAGAG